MCYSREDRTPSHFLPAHFLFLPFFPFPPFVLRSYNSLVELMVLRGLLTGLFLLAFSQIFASSACLACWLPPSLFYFVLSLQDSGKTSSSLTLTVRMFRSSTTAFGTSHVCWCQGIFWYTTAGTIDYARGRSGRDVPQNRYCPRGLPKCTQPLCSGFFHSLDIPRLGRFQLPQEVAAFVLCVPPLLEALWCVALRQLLTGTREM